MNSTLQLPIGQQQENFAGPEFYDLLLDFDENT